MKLKYNFTFFVSRHLQKLTQRTLNEIKHMPHYLILYFLLFYFHFCNDYYYDYGGCPWKQLYNSKNNVSIDIVQFDMMPFWKNIFVQRNV